MRKREKTKYIVKTFGAAATYETFLNEFDIKSEEIVSVAMNHNMIMVTLLVSEEKYAEIKKGKEKKDAE